MVSLCIKTNKNNIIQSLMKNISTINLDDIVFVQKDFSKYTNIIVHYLGNNIPVFYEELCSVLTECIIKHYESLIIHNLILLNYFYFDDVDMNIIESNCNSMLSSSPTLDNNASTTTEIANKYQYLWNDILRYISSNKSILLDGIVAFRVSNYINCLENIVDFAVNQFIINREYSEFIDLLKIYISSRAPGIDLVHLIYINSESILLDKDKNIITLCKDNLDAYYLSDISFSSNDYALNSLLSLLPKKIIVHLISPSDDFINTVKLIFGDVVTTCTDCNICKTYKLLNNRQGS
ncbi:MAG: putative sporulation protein YtxC [Clostridia bacterium]